jgi:hypothetical protein
LLDNGQIDGNHRMPQFCDIPGEIMLLDKTYTAADCD